MIPYDSISFLEYYMIPMILCDSYDSIRFLKYYMIPMMLYDS